ncbi:hypothetical protein BD626DRAFT_406035 [Schizophyllum amplum]|uniref:Uncharacterized protein n=1 Tax=Schizophyllum amplum TaxID=97359 RepID=A0A550C948_9AGAR|nr:hypothetical protein BD626DRAFT_406035 [Auriculariopsis ampla]
MLEYKHHPSDKCVMSGATTDLRRACLIPNEEQEEFEVRVAAVKEWIFGLPRGGLPFYLASPENGMIFCEDIGKMYCRGEFVLVPTFKTYMDTMKFMEGVKNRKENDRSPRRPPTVLASPHGTYRYVFIAYSTAACALEKQLRLQPQSHEDMNEGITPLDGKPCVAGSDHFPVLECYAHPFSISVFADKAFSMRRRTPLTDQWYALTRRILGQWEQKLIRPPQWFVDEPKLGEDDSVLSATEAMGYCLLPPHDPVGTKPLTIIAANGNDRDEHCWQKVGSWVDSVDPDATDPNAPLPSEQDSRATTVRTKHSLQRSPLRLRRSHRLRAKACPYASASPDCCPYPPSPPRRVASALRYRDVIRNPPAWAKRDGDFPTPTFSSNDWAYFSHRIALNGPAAT